jgi:hypothetical protein
VSGWLLALVLCSCLLAGFLSGIAAVYLYARHVFKSKMGQLMGQLGQAQPSQPTVAPPVE